jgi:hypothetical protein
MAALQVAIASRGDERHRVDVRRRHDLGDDVRSECGEPPQPAFLPRGDDASNAVVVRHRRACRREREPASGALDAAADRPRPGLPAPLAARPPEARERFAAVRADLRAGATAHDAPLRQQQVEHVVERRRALAALRPRVHFRRRIDTRRCDVTAASSRQQAR